MSKLSSFVICVFLLFLVRSTYGQYHSVDQNQLVSGFGYNPKIDLDAPAKFYPLYKYNLNKGIVNTRGYLSFFEEIKRDAEVLRFVLPKINEGMLSEEFFLSYVEITVLNRINGRFMSILKREFENYSFVYVDQNLDQNFTNDGEPIVLPKGESVITAHFKFLKYSIIADLTFPASNINGKSYLADTLVVSRKNLIKDKRLKDYSSWKATFGKTSHIIFGINPGFGGGGSQEFVYKNENTGNSITESFKFNRIGVDAFLGYEYKNIVVTGNVGYEFWKANTFNRTLVEDGEVDEFGGVRENKQGNLPSGYFYYSLNLGYDINISHVLILEPSIGYGKYNYRGEAGDRYNQNQENRTLITGSLKALLPVTQTLYIHAGLNYINYSFKLQDRISSFIISQEEELELSDKTMSAITFSFGLTIRL